MKTKKESKISLVPQNMIDLLDARSVSVLSEAFLLKRKRLKEEGREIDTDVIINSMYGQNVLLLQVLAIICSNIKNPMTGEFLELSNIIDTADKFLISSLEEKVTQKQNKPN